MPSLPVTASLLTGVESDMASALFQDDLGLTTPATATGNTIKCWRPLAVGNSLGIASGSNGCTLQLNDFGTGLHGVRGDGVAAALAFVTNTPVLNDLEAWCVYKTLGVASSNNDRLFDNGFGSSFLALFPTGSTTTISGGVMEVGPPYGGLLASADATKHILRVRRVGTTRLAEVDGHTVIDSATVTGAVTTAAPLYLLASVGGSPSAASMAAFYLYNPSGGLSTLQANQLYNYLGTKYSITLGSVPPTGGGAAPARPTGLDPMRPIHGIR